MANTKTKRKEIRVVNPSEELMIALERRAMIENRTIANMVETILNKELKVKKRT